MYSDFLNYIGLGMIDIGYILVGLVGVVIILLVLLIIQMTKVSKLNKKYQKFMQGKEAKSLEKEIGMLFEDNRQLRTSTDNNRRDIRALYKNLTLAYQKVGIVKYDAFREMGGKLSFSLALLNDNNDGFIMNSVHGCDGCYSYTKEIKNGVCSVTLGEEEQEALSRAMKN